jgi:hypothetical protein
MKHPCIDGILNNTFMSSTLSFSLVVQFITRRSVKIRVLDYDGIEDILLLSLCAL